MATAATRLETRLPHRDNRAFSLELLEHFTGLIEALTYRMGVTYQLAREDREDLKAALVAKIFSVDWQRVSSHAAGRDVKTYCRSMILNFSRKQMRLMRTNGFSGLLYKRRKIGEIPQPLDQFPVTRLDMDNGSISDGIRSNATNLAEIASASQSPESSLAASEVARKAQKILDPMEFAVVFALFGFDGGPERTVEETAKELNLTRREVSELSIRSIEKLRAALKVKPRVAVSFS